MVGIYMLPAGSTEWKQLDAGELHQGGNVWAHPQPSNGETLLLVGSDAGLMRSCGTRSCQISPAFSKTATTLQKDVANPGETIQYTISINPRGSQAITGNVSLTDILPSGVRYVAGSMVGGATYDSNSHTVRYNNSLADENPIIIRYDVIVKPETNPGTILQNIATLKTNQGDYATATTVSVPDRTRSAHTLLLVMAGGDNNLSHDMDRLRQNLERSANNAYVTTLLLQDGAGPDDARLYRVQHNNGAAPSYVEGETVWTWPENTASPHSLAGFIKGAINAYPNHGQVILSLVGHGNGWSPDTHSGRDIPENLDAKPWDSSYWTVLALGWDGQRGGLLRDESSQDSLSTRELGMALGWAYEATGQKLGLIYLDNCSMQMSEVAYEIRDYADYVLGSESMAWAAFPYDKHLADIRYITPLEIAERWLENEEDVLRQHEGLHYPFTLSIFDLQWLEQIVEYEDRLAQALMDALDQDFADTRTRIQNASFRTDMFESHYDGEINQADSYGDLYSFTLALGDEFAGNSDVRDAAIKLGDAIRDSRKGIRRHNARPWLYKQYWEWHDLGGISKYLPFNLEQSYPRLSYYNPENLAIAKDGLWDDLVKAYWRDDVARRGSVSSQECTDNCVNYGEQWPLRPKASYFSSSTGGRVDNIQFADEDIVAFDSYSDTWSLYFDGSDVGLRRKDVNAFHVMDDGNILLSLNAPLTLRGVRYDDSDIIKFTATSLGNRTRGTFSRYFDGSDVQLTTSGEDIDAIALLDNGDLVISTLGTARVAGVTARDEDLLRFHKSRLGNNTKGTWSLYLDGSDLKLAHKNEDIWAVWTTGHGEVDLSTYKNYSIHSLGTALQGDSDDIIHCTDLVGNGPSESKHQCQLSRLWNGDAYGLGNELIDGYSFGPALTEAVYSANVDEEDELSDADQVDDTQDDDVLDDDEYTEHLYLPFISQQ